MSKSIGIKKRAINYFIAIAMVITGFASMQSDSYGATIEKTVNVDSQSINLLSETDANEYSQNFDQKVQDINNQIYDYTNLGQITKKEVVSSNSTVEGEYMEVGEQWKVIKGQHVYRSIFYYTSDQFLTRNINTMLFKLRNKNKFKSISAYCIDVFTDINYDTVYQNEYLENLQYSSFKQHADKLRTIVANSIDNKSIYEMRQLTKISDLTEKEAVAATQLLIWKIIHNGEFTQEYGGLYLTLYNPNPVDYQRYKKINLSSESGRIVFKAMKALDNIPVSAGIGNLDEPKSDIKDLKIEKSSSKDKPSHISFRYMTDGKNSDGTEIKQSLQYFAGSTLIDDAKDIKGMTTVEESDGYTYVSFFVDNDKLTQENFNVRVSAIQSLYITNALLAQGNDRLTSQTLITTKATKNFRTAITEATVSILDSAKLYDVKLKKIDKAVFDATPTNTAMPQSAISQAKFELKDAKGNIIATSETDGTGYLTFENVKQGLYTLTETGVPSGYVALDEPIKLDINGEGVIHLNYKNLLYSSYKDLPTGQKDELMMIVPNVKIKGKVDFTKIDSETKKPVEGAIIELYKQGEQKPILTAITDDKGKLSSATHQIENLNDDGTINLEIGKYYFKEKEAPQGYITNQENFEFEINQDGQIVEIVMPNEKIGTISISAKKNWIYCDPSKLEEYMAVFELYANDEAMMDKKVYGNSTVTFENLPEKDKDGSKIQYTIKEAMSSEFVEIKDSYVDQYGVYQFFNTVSTPETVSIIINKQWQNVDKNQLSNGNYNVTFELYQNGVKTGDTRVIKGEGETSFDRLKKYDEKNEPYKYEVKEVEGDFTTKLIQEDERLLFINTPTDKQTTKITAKKLWVGVNDASNLVATIELHRNIAGTTDELVDTKTISGNGQIVFDNLDKFSPENQEYEYTLVEKEVAGFDSSVDAVTKDDGTKIYYFANKKNSGTLNFTKIDLSTRIPLAGATIEFYKLDEDTPFLTGKTDEEGKIIKDGASGQIDRITPEGNITLEPGVYLFKEIVAPQGYVLDSGVRDFTIMKNSINTILFENEKEKGNVKIIKKDAATQKNIGGAVFDIYKKSKEGKPTGEVIKQVTVPENGLQLELAVGDYLALEIVPPTGYVLPERFDDRYKSFTVRAVNGLQRASEDDDAQEVIIYNEKPNVPVPPTTAPMIYVTKVDENGKPLEGATIAIYRQGEDTPVITGVTNANGKLDKQSTQGNIDFTLEEDGRIKLENGDYVVRELQAPSGYILSTTQVQISLTTGNVIGVATIVNQKEKPVPVNITVNKTWTNIQTGKTADDYTVTVQLLQNGDIIDTKVIKGNTSVEFKDLPKKDITGKDYVYEVKEVQTDSFRQVSQDRQGDVYSFVNEVVPKTQPPIIIVRPTDTTPTGPREPREPRQAREEQDDRTVEITEERTPLAPPAEDTDIENVEEEPTPLSPPSEENEEIIEEDVPLGLPKTGTQDTTVLGLMLLGMGLVVSRRRKDKK